MNSKFTRIALTASLILMGSATLAGAAGSTNCEVVYGGGEVCPKNVSFQLNKLVQKPGKGGGDFVENLTINDPLFTVGQNVMYQIVIKNTGDKTISNVVVTDTLPAELSFVAGQGNFDQATRTLTFTVDSLEAGKSAKFFITAKVNDATATKGQQNSQCVTNTAKAVDDTRHSAEDSASICIQKQISTPQVFEKVPTKNIPNTGPEMLSLIGLIPAGAAGIFLRCKANS